MSLSTPQDGSIRKPLIWFGGFGGIVLMIDEFLLWLAKKSGQEFVAEINNLNVIVDHNTGQRPAPNARNRPSAFPKASRSSAFFATSTNSTSTKSSTTSSPCCASAWS